MFRTLTSRQLAFDVVTAPLCIRRVSPALAPAAAQAPARRATTVAPVLALAVD